MENTVNSNYKKFIPLSSRQPTPIEQQDLTEYINKVKCYAHKIASKYCIPNTLYDDLVSFGMYDLFRHLRVYDYTRGEFKCFLIDIYRAMLKFAKILEKKGMRYCYLDDSIKPQGIDLFDVDNKLTAEQILAMLTESEKKIMIDRFYHDKTLEEIGREFGLSKERIRQKINCILQKIQRRYREGVNPFDPR